MAVHKGAGGHSGPGVDAWNGGWEIQMGLKIGLRCSHVHPQPVVRQNAVQASFPDVIQKQGNNGNGFPGRDASEYFRLHTVRAGELAGSGVAAQGVPHIRHQAGRKIKSHVLLVSGSAEGQRHGRAAAQMLLQQAAQVKCGRHVSVHHQQRLFRGSQGLYLFDAAAGIQQHGFMAEMNGAAVP